MDFLFLLWSYFGLSTEEVYQNDEKKDGHERLVEAAILRAYRDASSHVLSVKEEYKEDLKKDAINIIKKF